mgnify:CR=1 FL=1
MDLARDGDRDDGGQVVPPGPLEGGGGRTVSAQPVAGRAEEVRDEGGGGRGGRTVGLPGCGDEAGTGWGTCSVGRESSAKVAHDAAPPTMPVSAAVRFTFYYWPIPGRGVFIRSLFAFQGEPLDEASPSAGPPRSVPAFAPGGLQTPRPPLFYSRFEISNHESPHDSENLAYESA